MVSRLGDKTSKRNGDAGITQIEKKDAEVLFHRKRSILVEYYGIIMLFKHEEDMTPRENKY